MGFAKSCKDHPGLPTNLAGVHLFGASVLIQALRPVTTKWTQNRSSVTMETSSHVIKVLLVCHRHFHLCDYFKNLSFKTFQKQMILCSCGEKISFLRSFNPLILVPADQMVFYAPSHHMHAAGQA